MSQHESRAVVRTRRITQTFIVQEVDEVSSLQRSLNLLCNQRGESEQDLLESRRRLEGARSSLLQHKKALASLHHLASLSKESSSRSLKTLASITKSPSQSHSSPFGSTTLSHGSLPMRQLPIWCALKIPTPLRGSPVARTVASHSSSAAGLVAPGWAMPRSEAAISCVGSPV